MGKWEIGKLGKWVMGEQRKERISITDFRNSGIMNLIVKR
jgi:hypothetical protein